MVSDLVQTRSHEHIVRRVDSTRCRKDQLRSVQVTSPFLPSEGSSSLLDKLLHTSPQLLIVR